jgi:hypothetical protein
VVVDDAEQGVTDVVRGEDLADNTARQILLQRALGLPTPSYLHTPLVRGADGDKLSKQNGATAIDTATPEPRMGRARHGRARARPRPRHGGILCGRAGRLGARMARSLQFAAVMTFPDTVPHDLPPSDDNTTTAQATATTSRTRCTAASRAS